MFFHSGCKLTIPKSVIKQFTIPTQLTITQLTIPTKLRRADEDLRHEAALVDPNPFRHIYVPIDDHYVVMIINSTQL